MIIILGFATLFSTLLGGLFALRKRDDLHLILGFSAGAVIGVAFFDLLPESLDLAGKSFSNASITTIIAAGFLLYMVLNRIILLHPHSNLRDECENETHQGILGAASLSLHSVLDGIGIGLAFQVSTSVGLVVAIAVLAHDFSDGINTVGVVLKHQGEWKQAFRWLLIDAIAPLIGIASTYFFTLKSDQLGLVLALFCGFFLYIGACDLLPESHHQHPKMNTSLMTLLGALVIYIAIHLA